MGVMVFGEKYGAGIVEIFAQLVLYPEFPLEPERKCFQEGAKTQWCKCEISFKEALEFKKRLFIKCDIRKILRRNARLLQTIGYCRVGVSFVMFFARKSLFLRRGNYFSVLDKSCRTIMIVRRNTGYT